MLTNNSTLYLPVINVELLVKKLQYIIPASHVNVKLLVKKFLLWLSKK